MDDAPITSQTVKAAATSKESFAGRDALAPLVRLLARQAARDALLASRVEQENRTHEED